VGLGMGMGMGMGLGERGEAEGGETVTSTLPILPEEAGREEIPAISKNGNVVHQIMKN